MFCKTHALLLSLTPVLFFALATHPCPDRARVVRYCRRHVAQTKGTNEGFSVYLAKFPAFIATVNVCVLLVAIHTVLHFMPDPFFL